MKKTIWVIDDESSILEVIKVLLEEHNYNVKNFNNPNDVLNFSDKEPAPSVICLDLYLSGADGRDLAKQLKKNEFTKKIPLLIMTADVHIDEKSKEALADDFLRKPFSIKDFLDKIDLLIQTSSKS